MFQLVLQLLPWALFGGLVGLTYYVGWYQSGTRYDLPSIEEVSLEGKTAIVTGANAGIGKAIATELARRKARVIMACRSKERALAALQDIQQATGNNNLEFWELDLCSFKSIRDFVKRWKQQPGDMQRIYLLINNAGVLYLHRWFIGDSPVTITTPDGHFSVQFLANYLGPFLFTNLLLDVIIKQPSARIINLTSSTHRFTSIDFSDIQGFKCGHFPCYSRSKLAIIYFTYELGRRLKEQGIEGVVCHAVHPGYIATDIVRYLPGPIVKLWHFLWMRVFGWTVETGSRGPLVVALHPSLGKPPSRYFSTNYDTPSSSISYQQHLGQKLWAISEQLVGLTSSS